MLSLVIPIGFCGGTATRFPFLIFGSFVITFMDLPPMSTLHILEFIGSGVFGGTHNFSY